MGASASKTAKAAGSAARKYPTRPPPNTTTRAAPAPSPVSSAAPLQQGNGPTGPVVHTSVPASGVKNEAIEQDARDPGLAARLTTLGAVQPNPHYSPTSTSQFDPRRNTAPSLPSDTMMREMPLSAFPDPRNNPVLRVLEARQRISEEAEEELRNVGRRSFTGRTYLDAGLIQLALMRQAKGEPDARIEAALGIKKGRLSVLRGGVLAPVIDV
ncbi:hypothetical protein NX059_005449 [Plenodomus lindquistii]|nr:hypothetical protein NX059_005449 [Plenodomus lindquistii]